MNDDQKDQVRRWMGGVLQMMGPKISTDAYNALSAARDNLNDILDRPSDHPDRSPAAADAAQQ